MCMAAKSPKAVCLLEAAFLAPRPPLPVMMPRPCASAQRPAPASCPCPSPRCPPHLLPCRSSATASHLASRSRPPSLGCTAHPPNALPTRCCPHTPLWQVVDDVLDLTGSSTMLGKPALNDLKSGVVTAPVLFAAQQQPELCALIKRKFRSSGDVDRVRGGAAAAPPRDA